MSTRNEPAGGWIDSLKLSHAGLLAPPQLDEAVGVMNAPDQLTLGLVAETVPEPGVAALDAASGRSRTDPATAATSAVFKLPHACATSDSSFSNRPLGEDQRNAGSNMPSNFTLCNPVFRADAFRKLSASFGVVIDESINERARRFELFWGGESTRRASRIRASRRRAARRSCRQARRCHGPAGAMRRPSSPRRARAGRPSHRRGRCA